ncbi:hypothetical protein FOQG_17857 [Fusarium oxysporum f. sp. raphani 54005]|uniref:Uncharacterized protein n=1 Tax=Fusarium oxysporum f. sp. raphani 54005 TaxID=1089458 RepID=X0C3U2_FUSOX|nr:hypothetical protein FOQG_17857 [Fusarium oxysporum f. sp. raphani 54005]
MFVGRRTAAEAGPQRAPRFWDQVPKEILGDPNLKSAIALLQANYNVEIPMMIHRISSSGAQKAAL